MHIVVMTDRCHSSPTVTGLVDGLHSVGWRACFDEPGRAGPPRPSITWGLPSGSVYRGTPMMNPPDAVMRAKSRSDAAWTLHLHGIPVDNEDLPPQAVRRVRPTSTDGFVPWCIHICDLTILSLTDAEGHAVPPSRLSQRILHAACRSVYVLGLHFASVLVMVHPQARGRWYVANVDPGPPVGADLARSYGASIGQSIRYWVEETQPQTVFLGADPEFVLCTRGGRLLDVSQHTAEHGVVGYDRQSHRRPSRIYPVAEVRPSPSPSPLVLAVHVEKALHRARRVLPVHRTRWIAGSSPLGLVATGGHIHFSGIVLTTPLLSTLDQAVGIPLMLLEKRVPAKRRRRRYGRMGDFRRKEHGGFEYRTPASWLVNPDATRAALTLAMVAVSEWRTLSYTPWPSSITVREFYLSRKTRFRRAFPSFWKRLQATPTARQYRYHLDYIRTMVEAGQEWDEGQDIKEAW